MAKRPSKSSKGDKPARIKISAGDQMAAMIAAANKEIYARAGSGPPPGFIYPANYEHGGAKNAPAGAPMPAGGEAKTPGSSQTAAAGAKPDARLERLPLVVPAVPNPEPETADPLDMALRRIKRDNAIEQARRAQAATGVGHQTQKLSLIRQAPELVPEKPKEAPREPQLRSGTALTTLRLKSVSLKNQNLRALRLVASRERHSMCEALRLMLVAVVADFDQAAVGKAITRGRTRPEKATVFRCRLDQALLERLDDLCAEHGIRMNAFADIAIETFMASWTPPAARQSGVDAHKR